MVIRRNALLVLPGPIRTRKERLSARFVLQECTQMEQPQNAIHVPRVLLVAVVKKLSAQAVVSPPPIVKTACNALRDKNVTVSRRQ